MTLKYVKALHLPKIAHHRKHQSRQCFYLQKKEGYYPVVCSINKLPVYLQNRNGNTPESYDQKNNIAAVLQQCTTQKIIVNKFRADACCYEKKTIKYLEKENITYYIRAEQNENLRIALEEETHWQPAMLNHCNIEVCSIEEPLFGEQKYRRIVAYRRKLSNEQATIFGTTVTAIAPLLPPQ